MVKNITECRSVSSLWLLYSMSSSFIMLSCTTEGFMLKQRRDIHGKPMSRWCNMHAVVRMCNVCEYCTNIILKYVNQSWCIHLRCGLNYESSGISFSCTNSLIRGTTSFQNRFSTPTVWAGNETTSWWKRVGMKQTKNTHQVWILLQYECDQCQCCTSQSGGCLL